MRSRFSAFAVGDVAYLLSTWHPQTRPPSIDLDPDVEWRGLEILATTAGGAHDDDGTVEFIARYWHTAARQRGEQHEHSAFVRDGGHWFYVGPVG